MTTSVTHRLNILCIKIKIMTQCSFYNKDAHTLEKPRHFTKRRGFWP